MPRNGSGEGLRDRFDEELSDRSMEKKGQGVDGKKDQEGTESEHCTIDVSTNRVLSRGIVRTHARARRGFRAGERAMKAGCLR